jgi:ssDNA-binding Zn-finger/Zn-ribbon topoisomerase 1
LNGYFCNKYHKMEVGALDSLTNAYVLPSNATKDRSYKCPDCNQKVIPRKGTIRRHHFAHSNLLNCQYFEHPNESQKHKDAKYKLAERLKNKFKIILSSCCPKCRSSPAALDDYEYTYDNDDNVIVEYRDPNNKYVADIAVLNNGNVKSIFEIKHTHETTTNVRPEPWYEITTEKIFEEEERIASSDPNHPENFLEKDIYYLSCVRNSRNRYCINCSVMYESWALNIPMLSKRRGVEVKWKQDAPCIICKRDQYSPQFIKGPRQLCQICLATDYEKIKGMYSNRPLFI